ncbi:hypothetical protein KC19_12G047200 [Ceratodon purpureus]|uniref:Uncharacterized protein n=1 Tax=Ceratodon purpureus TaxID=3225 RepID=A0A8T0G9E4_CERPU|nr:hypothetical protein KC19_12G047200 [Ceratodon purpureus]
MLVESAQAHSGNLTHVDLGARRICNPTRFLNASGGGSNFLPVFHTRSSFNCVRLPTLSLGDRCYCTHTELIQLHQIAKHLAKSTRKLLHSLPIIIASSPSTTVMPTNLTLPR